MSLTYINRQNKTPIVMEAAEGGIRAADLR